MRLPAILGMITASVLMGSTPVSSLSALRRIDHPRTCSPAIAHQISLIGSQGAFGIIAAAPQVCSQ